MGHFRGRLVFYMPKGFMLLPSIFLRTEAAERSRNLAERCRRVCRIGASLSHLGVALKRWIWEVVFGSRSGRGVRGAHELRCQTSPDITLTMKKFSPPTKVEELRWQVPTNLVISCNKFMCRAWESRVSLSPTNVICWENAADVNCQLDVLVLS